MEFRVRIIVEDHWDATDFDGGIEEAKKEAETMAADICREYFCDAAVESVVEV